MKERPILFSAPMVEAIRAGRKMMTRRAVKLAEFQRSDTPGYDFTFRDRAKRWHDYRSDDITRLCPYGRPGDRLRLLSSWATDARHDALKPTDLPRDGDPTELGRPVFWSHWTGEEKPAWCGKLRPGRFLPLWLRWLMPVAEVTGVRAERLQDISEEDIAAEGVTPESIAALGGASARDLAELLSPRQLWQRGWIRINGPESWAANPWVWVVSFKLIEAAR